MDASRLGRFLDSLAYRFGPLGILIEGIKLYTHFSTSNTGMTNNSIISSFPPAICSVYQISHAKFYSLKMVQLRYFSLNGYQKNNVNYYVSSNFQNENMSYNKILN